MENETQNSSTTDTGVDTGAGDSSAVDDDGWGDAINEYKASNGVQDDAAGSDNEDEDEPDRKPEGSEGDDTEAEDKPDEQVKPDRQERFDSRSLRAMQRETAADTQAFRNDIKEKLFPDMKTELTDADGDPIRSIEDVMRLINPATKTAENPQGRTFTEEEAGMYLLQASQWLDKQAKEAEAQIDKITEVNISLRDEMISVREKYGDILNTVIGQDVNGNNITIGQQVWSKYSGLLQLGSDGETIVGVNMPLEKFYDMVVGPLKRAGEKLYAQEQEAEKAKAEVNRTRSRSDRQDIYQPSGRTDLSDEDQEWINAEKEFLANR